MSYAFTFDASACTGCKACQAACKDKNNLPVGVLWRRVIEVSGGAWQQIGAAWCHDVFSYNLSMACNHCVHPKCAGVCPVNAYNVREDGIVILDSSRCIGCGYCNWACPYAVPQFNSSDGVMSKCNFCFDALEAGGEPACVSACPMRVLNFEKIGSSENDSQGRALWEIPSTQHPFPLPPYSRTQPHIRINSHPAMSNSLQKNVANREEIKPKHAKSELPLVAFTLLAQMAVGMFWASQLIFSFVQPGSPMVRLVSALLVGVMLAIGMFISFAHLGRKRNAWRVLGNLGKSSLSREILYLGLFGTGWLFSVLFPLPPLQFLTSCLGLILIYTMANVYGLRSMAVWNTWRTLAGFLSSAMLLGFYLSLIVIQVAAGSMGFAYSYSTIGWVNPAAFLFLLAEYFISTWGKSCLPVMRLRNGMILAALIALLCSFAFPFLAGLNFRICLFIWILVEEILGRWLFYGELEQRVL